MSDGSTDVLIAGGGPVGLTLALALGRAGLNVVVVEPQRESAVLAPAFDGRAFAIAYGNVRMYQALGVWDSLRPDAQPIDAILVSDAALGRTPSSFSLHFDREEIGVPLGQMVEGRHLRAALLAAVAGEPHIRMRVGECVAEMRAEGMRSKVRLAGGDTIAATLVVAADGRESRLREGAGIRTIAWDYPQSAIVATVAHERPHNGVAYEHFLPSGPFAILPLTGNRSSLVWTEKRAHAAALLALTEVPFAVEMQRRFGAHLGRAQPVGLRWSYPLRFHLAQRTIAPRLALVGDAAHGIHPIAGQGLNLGLKDVGALAETILDAARQGKDFGTAVVLARYERWRRFDRVTLALGTDALNRLFSNDVAPIRWTRDFGLGIVDAFPVLRRFLMRQAGGDLGQLPRLLKGEAA